MPDFGIGEALAALFGGGGLDALLGGGAAAAGVGEAAAASAPLDLAAIGGLPEVGASVVGDILPATGALASGLATEPAFAASALGAFAPGLDTSAAGLGLGGDLAGGGGALGYAPSSGTGVGATTPGATNLPSAITTGAPAGPGASSVGLAPGVNLPSGALPVDPTSAAAPTFTQQAAPVQSAITSGTFDPQGANFTSFGAPDSGVLAANAPSPLDTAAYPAGPIGAPATTAGSPSLDASLLGQSGTGGAGVVSPSVSAAAPSAGVGIGDAAPTSGGFGLNSLVTGAENSITKNPLGLALGGAGLGYSILSGQKQSAAVNALQNQAQQQSAEASTLTNYLNTGTLPAGLQASVDQATASAIANAKANAAAQGLPTDPTKNSALAATIASIKNQGPILAAQIGQQLAQTGASFAGLSDQLYTQLATIDQTQTQQIGKAIANMAAALNTGGTKIQIGGTSA